MVRILLKPTEVKQNFGTVGSQQEFKVSFGLCDSRLHFSSKNCRTDDEIKKFFESFQIRMNFYNKRFDLNETSIITSKPLLKNPFYDSTIELNSVTTITYWDLRLMKTKDTVSRFRVISKIDEQSYFQINERN